MARVWDTTEYHACIDMRRRCHDPRNKQFKDYGARGIIVCERLKPKLTIEQVHAIRADTRPSRVIAAGYGVHRVMISMIKRGARYHGALTSTHWLDVPSL